MKDIIAKIRILSDASIKEALRKIDEAGRATLFVCEDDGSLLGALTDGDIRRSVLRTGDLKDKVLNCYNSDPVFVVDGGYNTDDVKHLMLEKAVEVIPVVDAKKRIIDILFWADIFGEDNKVLKKIDIPVAIMAGGKGTRLDPFTRILPKPLIPIGDKAIIDIIMEKFSRHGVDEFFISINHKAKMIKSYFEEMNSSYKIRYIEEESPLGTAGSLTFLRGKVADSLLVSNCDIIIDYDYSEIVDFHKAHNYDITIVGSYRNFVIPYGVCETKDNGLLVNIVEKPEYDFIVNTGMYLLRKNTLEMIPEGERFHITDLVRKVKDNQGTVGIFPITEKSWIDIGQWEEYKKVIERLQT